MWIKWENSGAKFAVLLRPLVFTGDVCPSALRFHEAPQSHDVESNFPTAGISCCYTSIQCAETTHLKTWRMGIVTRTPHVPVNNLLLPSVEKSTQMLRCNRVREKRERNPI